MALRIEVPLNQAIRYSDALMMKIGNIDAVAWYYSVAQCTSIVENLYILYSSWNWLTMNTR